MKKKIIPIVLSVFLLCIATSCEFLDGCVACTKLSCEIQQCYNETHYPAFSQGYFSKRLLTEFGIKECEQPNGEYVSTSSSVSDDVLLFKTDENGYNSFVEMLFAHLSEKFPTSLCYTDDNVLSSFGGAFPSYSVYHSSELGDYITESEDGEVLTFCVIYSAEDKIETTDNPQSTYVKSYRRISIEFNKNGYWQDKNWQEYNCSFSLEFRPMCKYVVCE